MGWLSDPPAVVLLAGAGLLVAAMLAGWRWHSAGEGHRLRMPYLFDALVLALAGLGLSGVGLVLLSAS